jgi:hypothetical protein
LASHIQTHKIQIHFNTKAKLLTTLPNLNHHTHKKGNKSLIPFPEINKSIPFAKLSITSPNFNHHTPVIGSVCLSCLLLDLKITVDFQIPHQRLI